MFETQPTNHTYYDGLLNRLWGKRMLRLPRELTEVNCNAIIAQVYELSVVNPLKPILILCDSHGGSIEPAVRLAEYIKKHAAAPIVTMVQKAAASAAIAVFAAGHLRVMHVEATLGFHGYRVDGYYGPEFTETLAVRQPERAWFLRRQATSYIRALEDYTNQRFPDALFGKDMVYLKLPQSKALGLVDMSYLNPPTEPWERAQVAAEELVRRRRA